MADGIGYAEEEAPTLRAESPTACVVCYSQTLNTIDRHAVCAKEEQIYIVRRLTPIECARLQGMPDWWCADVPHSDSAEYKLWGNGMALPNALYIMEGFIDEKNS